MPDALSAVLDSLPSNWQLHLFEAVDSTQDTARALARAGAPSRSIVVAEYQRAGRGRQGRSWTAASGSALLVSIVLREQRPGPAGAWRWTSAASVALVEAIRELFPELQPAIKWPNDVMLGSCKVAGILAESTWDGQELVVIVGIGVNVNAAAAELSSVGQPATSLRVATGHAVDRGRLLLGWLRRLEHWSARPWPELVARWQSNLWGKGQRMRLLDFGREEEVVVLGANLDGSLQVRLADGTQRHTTTGELII